MSMSRCSSTVLTVCGRVGLVDDGSTFGSDATVPYPDSAPRRSFITCAVCQVRRMTYPIRPIAWESEPIIEIAPMSCRMSSAAMVEGRMRDSANARSSGTAGFR